MTKINIFKPRNPISLMMQGVKSIISQGVQRSYRVLKAAAKYVLTDKYLMGIIILALVLRCVLITNAIGSRAETQAFNGDEVLDMDPILRLGELHTLNPHYFNYPSLYLYVCAVFILPVQAFGGDVWPVSMLIGRTISLFFGILSIIATYFVGKELYDHRTGLLSALFLTLTPMHIAFSVQLKPDTMQLFFVILSIFYCIKIFKYRKPIHCYVAMVFAGLAFTTKYVGVLLLPIIAISYLFTFARDENSFFKSSATMVKRCLSAKISPYAFIAMILSFIVPVVLGTVGIIIAPLEFALGFGRSMFDTRYGYPVMGKVSPLAWPAAFAGNIGISLLIISLIGVIFAVYCIKDFFVDEQVQARAICLIWVLFFFGLFLAASGRVGGHYMLPVLPFFLVFGAAVFYHLSQLNADHLSERLKHVIGTVSICSILAASAIWTCAAITPTALSTDHDTRYIAADWMLDNIGANASIFYDLSVYVPTVYQDAVLNDFEPPGDIVLYNNTYSDYDQLVLTATWHWFYTSPLDYVNESEPDYIIVSSGHYEMHLNNSRRPHKAAFYAQLFDGSLGYVKVKEFAPEVHLKPYDLGTGAIRYLGTGAIRSMLAHPNGIWSGPRIIVFERELA